MVTISLLRGRGHPGQRNVQASSSFNRDIVISDANEKIAAGDGWNELGSGERRASFGGEKAEVAASGGGGDCGGRRRHVGPCRRTA